MQHTPRGPGAGPLARHRAVLRQDGPDARRAARPGGQPRPAPRAGWPRRAPASRPTSRPAGGAPGAHPDRGPTAGRIAGRRLGPGRRHDGQRPRAAAPTWRSSSGLVFSGRRADRPGSPAGSSTAISSATPARGRRSRSASPPPVRRWASTRPRRILFVSDGAAAIRWIRERSLPRRDRAARLVPPRRAAPLRHRSCARRRPRGRTRGGRCPVTSRRSWRSCAPMPARSSRTTPSRRPAAEASIGYVENNRRGIANYRIVPLASSGPMEKGVDITICRRFKTRGMSWFRRGVSHLLHLRAAAPQRHLGPRPVVRTAPWRLGGRPARRPLETLAGP